MPNYNVTFEIAIPGAVSRTLTRPVTAPTLEEALRIAKEDLVVITLKAAQEVAP